MRAERVKQVEVAVRREVALLWKRKRKQTVIEACDPGITGVTSRAVSESHSHSRWAALSLPGFNDSDAPLSRFLLLLKSQHAACKSEGAPERITSTEKIHRQPPAQANPFICLLPSRVCCRSGSDYHTRALTRATKTGPPQRAPR